MFDVDRYRASMGRHGPMEAIRKIKEKNMNTEVIDKAVGLLPTISLKTATLIALAGCAFVTIMQTIGFVRYISSMLSCGLDLVNILTWIVGIMFDMLLTMFFATLYRNQK